MNADVAAVDSRVWYLGLIALISLQRLWELALSKRHARKLEDLGGYEVGGDHYRWMVTLHIAFLISCALEPWLADRRFSPLVGGAALVVLAAAQILRWWTMATLGERWTTRVMVVPGARPTITGPYRWMRHPNYVAVIAEMAAIPMVHTAWVTAVVFSLLNLGVLSARLKVENEVLETMDAKNDPSRASQSTWA